MLQLFKQMWSKKAAIKPTKKIAKEKKAYSETDDNGETRFFDENGTLVKKICHDGRVIEY